VSRRELGRARHSHLNSCEGQISNGHNRIITVAVGRFESLVAWGMEHVLGEDPLVQVLANGLGDGEIERFVANEAPRVAIIHQAVPYPLLVRLKSYQPATSVIVLATNPERLFGEMLLEVGATCLGVAADKRDILTALRAAARGEPTYLSPADDREDSLTGREREVFELLSEGATNPEIGIALHISPRTVETYVSMIFRKLGVRNGRELIGMRVPHRRK
jgi:DNA-binding NarL/FixJ family response regulator